ncbi:MAG: GTP cyclohydrolase II [Candidatus Hodarchaeales archaeon]
MPLSSPSLEEILSNYPGQDCPDYPNCEHCERGVCIRIVSVANLPTRFGQFRIVGFVNNKDRRDDHAAIIRGDIAGKERVLCRVHSECLTGDALGSLRCDCRDQLTTALQQIGQSEEGILLYLRQEGRGIGLLNKLRAYALQDHGFDTVDANVKLGFRDDERDYNVAAGLLRKLDVRSVRLMTNNPDKIDQLQQHDIQVTERVPLIIPPTPFSKRYLKTKASRSRHMLEEPPEDMADVGEL